MTKESEVLEYKSVWKDDHLKAICAFANAKGGTLLIGVDDNGKAVGVPKVKKLLEDLPNKINEKLGLLPAINLKEIDGVEVIELHINKQRSPISYNGKFYLRSGSTTQELQGQELISFIFNKSGMTWDSIVEPKASYDDLDQETIDTFKKMSRKRAPFIENETDNYILLEKLKLIENGQITRAALMLFGKDPQRYSLMGYIRIGRFSSPSDVLTTDEIKGNLFKQLQECRQVLQSKYIHLFITGYKGMYRQEELEYPSEALREIITNAILHRDYTDTYTQFRVYDDEVHFWNPGKLLPELTIDSLKRSHSSKPRNPLIASVFFLADLIESWGRGTIDIVEDCVSKGFPEPEYEIIDGGFMVRLSKDPYRLEKLKSMGFTEKEIKLISFIKEHSKISNQEYQNIFSVSRSTSFRDLTKYVESGLLNKSGESGKDVTYILGDLESFNVP